MFHSKLVPERSKQTAPKTKYNLVTIQKWFPNSYQNTLSKTTVSCILCCLIPDFWLEQSVHWETRLGLEGLKRLLAKNNPNQRNDTSKVTPHLTKRKIGLQWTESCPQRLTAILSGTFLILTSLTSDKSPTNAEIQLFPLTY